MPVKIQVKRGPKASLPQLNSGEFAFTTDTRELYIGTSAGNRKIPVEVNGKIPVDEIPELTEYLKTSGGTLTGNLTGKHITGTWLQTTAITNSENPAAKIAIIDNAGWVYYRTPAQILADIEAVPTSRKINGKTLTSDVTLTANELGAAPQYQYGTTDIGEGAALTTGTLYFVYE